MPPTSQIDAIASLPHQLEEALKGLTDAQVRTPYREGGWTVLQLVHHIADSHMHAYIRMKFIVAEEHPTLKPYDQDLWATLPDVEAVPIEASLQIIRGLHQRWASFLRGLPAAAWSRAALHPERGEVTLESMVATYAGHGAKHVGHILGLRRTRNW